MLLRCINTILLWFPYELLCFWCFVSMPCVCVACASLLLLHCFLPCSSALDGSMLLWASICSSHYLQRALSPSHFTTSIYALKFCLQVSFNQVAPEPSHEQKPEPPAVNNEGSCVPSKGTAPFGTRSDGTPKCGWEAKYDDFFANDLHYYPIAIFACGCLPIICSSCCGMRSGEEVTASLKTWWKYLKCARLMCGDCTVLCEDKLIEVAGGAVIDSATQDGGTLKDMAMKAASVSKAKCAHVTEQKHPVECRWPHRQMAELNHLGKCTCQALEAPRRPEHGGKHSIQKVHNTIGKVDQFPSIKP
jgi:hypothetical protein